MKTKLHRYSGLEQHFASEISNLRRINVLGHISHISHTILLNKAVQMWQEKVFESFGSTWTLT